MIFPFFFKGIPGIFDYIIGLKYLQKKNFNISVYGNFSLLQNMIVLAWEWWDDQVNSWIECLRLNTNLISGSLNYVESCFNFLAKYFTRLLVSCSCVMVVSFRVCVCVCVMVVGVHMEGYGGTNIRVSGW